MKLKMVLTVSAIYLAILGLGFMFAPRDRYRCRSSGCLSRTHRLSPYVRRSLSWDCGFELDGSACRAFYGA